MILDAINNYLQHQPHKTQSNEKVAATNESQKVDLSPDQQKLDGISLSQRREYLEFLSGHFDVTNLNNNEMNQLQSLLHEYGFISSNELNSMRSLSLAQQLVGKEENINAVEMLNTVKQQSRELEIPYSTAQQIDKVRVVIENMASARNLMAS